ncbi:Conserved hypothetical protein 2099 [Nitrosococcus oceani ATCC 19707]|uniref:YhdP central domain-containing protein n=2 Tax=Nitrosococcus oceani TaxID=1229 RepID=Q3J7T7_NITOC|nr:YhdP family protein [Nitrosococcus oceani]ABA59109.1 Conserved hypothetical protein 2099 [Nitrosococcus oceani ATCC 19707]EDZ66273.1 conserved hypothetical protein TIGR02099 [Nitrosococcus oceani AFC27]KFI18431.1 hypothetical protein IB75_14110 [Nitrosococcus oceani C-27]GEM20361.1 TIGR02099 family protein [Nitrosococcus oceani]
MAFIRLLPRYFYLSLGILACCIVLIFGALWTLWTVVEDEPATISRWLSTALGREVQVSEIALSWRGGEPRLHLTGVRIIDPQTERQLLSFREIYLDAAPSRTSAEGEWMLRHLTIIGGELTVERKPAGCIRVYGLQDLESPCPHPPRLPAWVLNLTQLTLVDMAIRWLDPVLERKPLELQVRELQLRNEEDFHWVEGKATLAEKFGSEIAVKAKFTGGGIRDPRSQGVLYLKGEGLRLASWQASDFLAGLHFIHGRGDLELGLRWGKAALHQVLAKFDWENLKITGNTQTAEAPGSISFQRLAGTAYYHPLAQGWSLKVPRLVVIRDERAWPATALQVKMEREPVSKLQGRLTFLQLQDVVPLLQFSNQLDPQLRLFLAKTKPVGELRNIKAVLPLGGEEAMSWKFSATAAQFGTRPWRHWPGYQGLSFELQLMNRGGQVRINSRNAQILSGYLEKPVAVDALGGRLSWVRKGKDWQVRVDDIKLQNQDLALRGGLRLEASSKVDTPHLDLSLMLTKIDLAALPQYLPSPAMKPGLVRWLKQAFPQGGAAEGSLVFQGPWSHFPSSRDGSQLTVELDIRGAKLNYARGWPVLERVAAHLHSDGQYMTIHANEGQMFSARVAEATVQITDLGAAIVPLTITVRAQGGAEDAWRFIQGSPLRKKYGEFLEGIEVTGDTDLKLNLAMLLGNKKKRPKVEGELIFTNAYLRQQNNPFLELAAIEGSLHFTPAGLKSENLVARLLERPIKVELLSLPRQRGGTEVQLSLEGHLEARQLAEKWFPSLSTWVHGAADFIADVTFKKARPDEDKVTIVRVNSGLKGVKVALPPPLAKPAEQRRKLLWEFRGTDRDKKQVTLVYGDWLQGVFEMTGRGTSSRLLRGEVRVGNNSDPPVLSRPGVWLAGALPKLSIGAWWETLKRAGQGDSSQLLRLNHIALQVDQMELFGGYFEDVMIEANRMPSRWQAQVTGPSLTGWIRIPGEGSEEPLAVDLEHLHLHSIASDSSLSSVNPQTWPAFDLICRQCRYKGYDLGVVKVYASPHADGFRLEELEIVSPTLQLEANGDWTIRGETQWSHVDIKAYSPSLSQLLTEAGHQANVLGGETEMELIVGWPGPPTLFSLERLEGSMRLTMDKGRLLDVEPGAGRLFGLLSITTLPRRLALDFSDIFGKGFAFDRVKGAFSIREGNAYSKDLVIEGPTARVQASGRIGLATQDYDQIIAVTPQVSSSLPLAGAMAGGPVGLGVGTAIMLADELAGKIFNTGMEQLLTYYYAISGPWKKPVVTRAKNFFSSKERE